MLRKDLPVESSVQAYQDTGPDMNVRTMPCVVLYNSVLLERFGAHTAKLLTNCAFSRTHALQEIMDTREDLPHESLSVDDSLAVGIDLEHYLDEMGDSEGNHVTLHEWEDQKHDVGLEAERQPMSAPDALASEAPR